MFDFFASVSLVFLLGSQAAGADTPGPLKRQFTQQEIESCIRRTCGSAQTNRAGSDADDLREPIPPLFYKIWSENYKSEYRKSLELAVDSEKLLVERTDEALRIGFQLSADQMSNLRSYLGAAWMFAHSLNWMPAVFIDPKTSKANVDERKLEQIKSQYSDDVAVAIDYLVRKTILSAARSIGEYGVSFDDETALLARARYPDLTTREAVRKYAAFGLTVYAEAAQKFGPIFELILGPAEKALITKVANQGELTKAEQRIYSEFIHQIEQLHLSLDPKTRSVFEKVRGGLQSTLELLERNGQIKSFKENLTLPNRDRQVSLALKDCENAFARLISFHRGKDRLLNQVVHQVRTASKAVARKYFDSETGAAELERKIEETRFLYPLRLKESLAIFRAHLRDQNRILEGRLNLLRSRQPGWQNLILFELLKRVDIETASETSDPVLSLRKTCDDLTKAGLVDRSSTFQGRIQVSLFSATTPEQMGGIIAHEFGHIVSAAARLQNHLKFQFQKSLACVAKRNPLNFTPVSEDEIQDTQTSEEDWADHFSARVIRELKKSHPAFVSKNLGCALVADIGSIYGFNDWVPKDKTDTHSSAFVRLLMTSQDSGAVARECQPFLDEIIASGRNLVCE